VVQISSKCFLTGNSSVKFSLLRCTEVIQNYDLQHLPTHQAATPGSRPPNLSFSVYHRLLQGQGHMSSLCSTGLKGFQPITFAIIKDWLWLNSMQTKGYFSINAGDKLKIKTGSGVLLSSDC